MSSVPSSSTGCSSNPFVFSDTFEESRELKRAPLISRRLYCNRLRRIHSKGAIIVLFWDCLVWASVNFIGEFANKLRLQVIGTKLLNRNTFDLTRLGRDVPIHYAYYATIGAIWLLGTPLAGWLADVRFGRYKVTKTSLWMMWCAVVTYSFLFLTSNHDQPSSALSTVGSVVSFLALTVYMCGLVGFLINSVQFGMDQMPDASSPELSAFIHWYVFAMGAGIWSSEAVLGFSKYCSSSNHHRGAISTAEIVLLAILPTLILSLPLLSDSYLRHHLIVEPQSKNPLKVVVSVLKYVAKHKTPLNPSAYVYTLKSIPNRFDFAKTLYGGPFTTEQVEDVRTFFRILLLMSPAILILTGSLLTGFNVSQFEEHLKSLSAVDECRKISIKFFSYDYRLLTMFFIISNEVFFHPVFVSCYYKYCRTLIRIVIGAILGLALIAVLATLEIAGHTSIHPQVPCMFLIDSGNVSFLEINYLPVVVPVNIILAVQTILFISGSWEFICAQAPYSMRGLLIGAVWATLATATILSNVITLGWYFGSNRHPSESGVVERVGCGGFYFLSIFFIGVLGLTLFCVGVKCYRQRMREEREDQQLLVEEIYAKEVDAARNVCNNSTIIESNKSSGYLLGVTCSESTTIQ